MFAKVSLYAYFEFLVKSSSISIIYTPSVSLEYALFFWHKFKLVHVFVKRGIHINVSEVVTEIEYVYSVEIDQKENSAYSKKYFDRQFYKNDDGTHKNNS